MLEFVLDNRLQLVPFLWIIGNIIKNTRLINDKYIPVILGIVGVSISVLMEGEFPDNVIQGILVTGLAVYGNEIVKQHGRSD